MATIFHKGENIKLRTKFEMYVYCTVFWYGVQSPLELFEYNIRKKHAQYQVRLKSNIRYCGNGPLSKLRIIKLSSVH